MEYTTQLKKFDSNLWDYYIDVPDDMVQSLLEDSDDRRVICTLNGREEFHCALMPKGDGTYFINVNKERRKKLHLRAGSQLSVKLKKDESEYGLPMPEELEELLELDDKGSRLFHALTPGKQRSLIHMVGKLKRTDSRIRKAVAIVDYLKASGGELDYKELNQAFKDANRRDIP
ncbi:MAG: YdeI/OmpD-associated family protein [Saprospiraceae bacterium]|nr:YdeI/OmpD-associated family protein [Saprospiraceae bacterium]